MHRYEKAADKLQFSRFIKEAVQYFKEAGELYEKDGCESLSLLRLFFTIYNTF